MQVKFRGKRVDGGGWVFGFLIGNLDPHKEHDEYRSWFIHNGVNISVPVEVEQSSIGMFTGLTDKNGKEIYGAVGESGGDIMKLEPLWFIEEDVERIEVVVWDNEMSRFIIGKKTNIYPNSNWEIIGNAFDNPELLEK